MNRLSLKTEKLLSSSTSPKSKSLFSDLNCLGVWRALWGQESHKQVFHQQRSNKMHCELGMGGHFPSTHKISVLPRERQVVQGPVVSLPRWATPPVRLGLSGRNSEKFRKDPGNTLRAFPGIPVESTAGMPQTL